MPMYQIDNVNEEDVTYESRTASEDTVARKVAAALLTLDKFPNDSVVITYTSH